MPIYEYKCSECNHKFERRCSFSESDNAVACPNCQSPAKKQVSIFAAVSRGPGGGTMPIAGAGGGCGPSCPATSCGTCHN
ncbi:MAG: zinc ribbon domain-containing protein [Chloroflexota bacterium]|nr:zinc ribbon domain-containing protein [Chloroflexota bacterium]